MAPKRSFHFFALHLASFCRKMIAALGTSKAEAHATHVSVAQHISKSTPFRYYSLQCKPSRFRPHAIADFRLHASFRRSETVCRARIDGRRCALPRGPSIESAALVVDKARCVKSKAQNQNRQSQICRSQTPLISPPSAPAHSARPPKN